MLAVLEVAENLLLLVAGEHVLKVLLELLANERDGLVAAAAVADGLQRKRCQLLSLPLK